MVEKRTIHVGGPFNARVYRVEDADGAVWIEKDFSSSPLLVRNTIGRFLVWRECMILRRLEDTGVVPGGARKLSPFTLREDFVEGKTLHDIQIERIPAEMPPREFFETFLECVKAVHARRFVHLDLHNWRNVVVAPGWKPVLLDWQSALPTFWIPGPLRRMLERIDLAGVLKFWDGLRPGEMPPNWQHFLERSRFIRRYFWIPRLHRPPV